MNRHDGRNYQSYHAFRAPVNRQMSDRAFDVMNDPIFKQSNEVFDGVLKKLKREEKLRPVKQKDPITLKGMAKIWDYFCRCKDAVSLL